MNYRFGRREPAPICPPAPPRRLQIDTWVRTGCPRQTAKAGRSESEFWHSQLGKLRYQKKKPRRPLSLPPRDDRCWVDDGYAAVTQDGELVMIREQTNRSPIVRRPTEREVRILLAVDRPITVGIALYQGDDLDRGSAGTGHVTRYHRWNDLGAAFKAGHVRAKMVEAQERRRRVLDAASHVVIEGPPPCRPRAFPAGNYTAYLPEGDLIVQVISDAGPVFPNARRVRAHLRRLGIKGHRPTKVVRRAILRVEPVPRSHRIELKLERIPRWRPDGQGGLVPEPVGKLRPVHRLNRTINEALKRLRQITAAMVQGGSLGSGWLQARMERIRRALPAYLRDHLGLHAPSFSDLSQKLSQPMPRDQGHWIRWTYRGRLWETEIGDLEGFVERFGHRHEVWLVQDRPGERLRVVVPSGPLDSLTMAA